MKRLVALASAFVLLAAPAADATPAPAFVHWFGFRTADDGIYCLGSTPQGVWNAFLCFRPRNGFFVRMAARDLSSRARIQISRGFDDVSARIVTRVSRSSARGPRGRPATRN